MPHKTVIVGGGAAGLGAAGGVKAVRPDGEVVVYTEYEDVAYSPCGIPYVHGKEISDFEKLFLATKEQYVEAGIDVHYETTVSRIDTTARTVDVEGEGPVAYDELIVATGFDYADPGVPGGDLEGLYYVKNIRRAMEWDKVLESVQRAVVVHATPLGVEMTTSLAHRGIETHLVDPNPWPLADMVDPDIMAPVEESWRELGVVAHLNTTLKGFLGQGHVGGVATSDGELPCDLVVVATHKEPNTRLAAEAGLALGSTGGIVVDERMRTSVPGVFAAGDCTEIPHGLTRVPLQGLTGSHAYAQGKVAGDNAGGVPKQKDLGEASMAKLRADLLATIPMSDRIIFAPPAAKHTVVVFTDIECGFCRKLHADIAEYNKRGIAVQYLAFPRMGLGSEDFRKMVGVWCAKDRRQALTDAKNDKSVPIKNCDNPVTMQYALGQRMGLTGTPMILATDGTQISGYLNPDQLLAAMERHAATVAAEQAPEQGAPGQAVAGSL